MMQRFAWKAYVTDVAEYKKRHDEIWPEMTAMLDEAGIHNYTIWNVGNELFAYYECYIDPQESRRILRESEVSKRWAKHMEGLLVYEDGTGKSLKLTQVFLHE